MGLGVRTWTARGIGGVPARRLEVPLVQDGPNSLTHFPVHNFGEALGPIPEGMFRINLEETRPVLQEIPRALIARTYQRAVRRFLPNRLAIAAADGQATV